MQRRSVIANLLRPVGVLAAACAAAPPAAPDPPPAAPPESKPGQDSTAAPTTAPHPEQDVAARKRIQHALNPLAVDQGSFQRLFKDGTLTPEKFPEFVATKCGLKRVQWSATLLPGLTAESAKPLRQACDAQGVTSLLLDPVIGPGLASADDSARSAAAEKLKPWCAVAVALGCTGLNIDLRGEGDYDQQLPRAVAGAKLAIKVAGDAGLPVVARSLGGMTSNGTFMAALMQQLQVPAALRLEPSFDSWKVDAKNDYDRVRGFMLLLPYAASVLADYSAFLPSGESVNFRTDYFMRVVRQGTYRGPVTIFYKGSGSEADGVAKAKQILMKYKCSP